MKAKQFISTIFNGYKVSATILSLLVALNTFGITSLAMWSETEVLEEVNIEFVALEKKSIEAGEEDVTTRKFEDHIDYYSFSIIEKDQSPSSIKPKYYLLYQQLSYDKRNMFLPLT